MQPVEDEELLEAEVVLEAARRVLVEKQALARRAQSILASAQLAAADAKAELQAATQLCIQALWGVVEAKSR
jgi:hypothetical protein